MKRWLSNVAVMKEVPLLLSHWRTARRETHRIRKRWLNRGSAAPRDLPCATFVTSVRPPSPGHSVMSFLVFVLPAKCICTQQAPN
ncbi:hypothetical protein OH76DRAFT_530610 [Lentinus brumalis]|uniref:Uncharacterized protein n=1 Tax=Lentinus brumalis TaxID=2498619 RepID=A0A371DA89_9APHY|nr:hypothetical protein OH76DRAFT_530610 [Polyporus brumalis]